MSSRSSWCGHFMRVVEPGWGGTGSVSAREININWRPESESFHLSRSSPANNIRMVVKVVSVIVRISGVSIISRVSSDYQLILALDEIRNATNERQSLRKHRESLSRQLSQHRHSLRQDRESLRQHRQTLIWHRQRQRLKSWNRLSRHGQTLWKLG